MKNSFAKLSCYSQSQGISAWLYLKKFLAIGLWSLLSLHTVYSQVPYYFYDFFVPPTLHEYPQTLHINNSVLTRPLDRDSSIAREYLSSAVQSYKLSDYANFESFLATVFEYDHSFSDGWYLSATLAIDRGFPLLALNQLKQSLDLNSFIYFSYEQVETLFIHTLHGLQMYDSIIEYFYLSVNSRSQVQFRMEHPDQTFYLLDALDRSQLRSSYPHAFRQALLSFPDDPRIQVLQSPLGIPPSLRIEQYLGLSSGNQVRYMTALELFISRLGPVESRRQWIQQLIQLGGNPSNRMLRFYVEDSLSDEQRLTITMNDVVFRNTFHDIFEAAEIHRLLANTPYQTRFRDFFLSQGRDLYEYDRNLDGIAQEWFRLEDGLLVEWYGDHDQTNVVNHRLSFSAGVPRTYTFQDTSGLWTFQYQSYPYLGYVDYFPFQEQSLSANHYFVRFFLRPFELPLPIVDPIITLGQELVFPRVFIRLQPHYQELIFSVTNRLERESYRIERVVDQQPFLETRFSPFIIITREDLDETRKYERYILDFPEQRLTLEFFDSNEDGWFEYIIIHGIPGIYYRPMNENGSMVAYMMNLPGEISPEQRELIHRYQNILFFRGQAQ